MGMLDDISQAEKSAGSIWKPEPGDCFAGIIVNVRPVPGKFGEQNALDIKSEEDGCIYTVFLKTVLENELKRQNAEIGDEVGIKYLGLTKNYHDYVVKVRKAQASSNGALV